MRLPLPQHIRLKYAIFFAFTLFMIQQAEHTDPLFSGLCAAYIVLASMAFNAAGGLIYPSGAWIFANAMLVVIIGIVCKVILGEPGQSNLDVPNTTMAAYCGSMIVFGLVAALVRKLTAGKGLLSNMAVGDAMKKAAVGSFLLGTVSILFSFSGAENGTFFSAFRQINHFNEMSIMLGTFYQVKLTGGRRSTNWVVWVALIWGTFFGILSISKQGMLTPVVCWFVAAVVAGHNFTRRQLILVVSCALAFQLYLAPYSQYGRNFRDENQTIASNYKLAVRLLGNPEETRRLNSEASAEGEEGDEEGARRGYFNKSQGFLDRLTMIKPDDLLISYTDDGNSPGYFPTIEAIYNVVPRFINKEKEKTIYGGNEYGRELGIIGADDTTTGISFSPTSDAYHQGYWFGIFALMPLTTFFIFFIENKLSGDIRVSPWGILFVVMGAHSAPELGVGGQIYEGTYGAFGVVIIALLARYVLPIVSGVITNSERSRVRKTVDFKPVLRSSAQDHASAASPDTP